MAAELGYFTISVKDVPRAMKFYGALFGWTFEQSGNGAHINNTEFPLGLAQGEPVDLHFAYFRIADMVATTAKVKSLGGSVKSQNEYPSGLNAVCIDDQGTMFSLWQPAPGF